ncbi:hypothetical protein [Dactylosporangium sp. NPDC005555]|uniref:hypothetical protein n=1 Tax=Dactylosporangium sp. NPDC005555 TaxID=3154889 RepID=UPI0033BF7F9A
MSTVQLTSAEEQRIIEMLRKEDRDRIEVILRTASALLSWLADAVGLAADLYRKIRNVAGEFWQALRSLFY